jgi:Flp pilus assembly protein TadG
MFNYLREHGEKGQTAVLLALAMIGLLAIVGLALDGGMLYWNQRRAQNGADAAAIAGVTALADHVQGDAGCSAGSEQDVLALIQEYAGVNEVPDAETGQNVEAFYLVESMTGDRVNLIYPSTGKPWQVGETGVIPCDQCDRRGLSDL